ncbi:MAG TPA: phosphate ABC transporter permease subunit PstC, partial [Solimonas sp.]
MNTAVTAVAGQLSPISSRHRLLESLLRILTRTAAITVLVMLSGVILSLIDGSLPALKTFGLSFLHTQSWNPVTETFGAAAPIYVTIVTSLIAMLIGFPISIGIAVFITELCPPKLKQPIGTAIELL